MGEYAEESLEREINRSPKVSDNVPLPTTKKPRGRKQAAGKEAKATYLSSLLELIDFALEAQEKACQFVYGQHFLINNGYLVATNGAIMAGGKVPKELESISACPNSYQFQAAIKKCDTSTVYNREPVNGKLIIKSGKFTARIDCTDFERIPLADVDPPQIAIAPALLQAFVTCSVLTDSDPKSVGSCLMLTPDTALTLDHNRAALIEFHHAMSLPIKEPILLPEAAVKAVIKQKEQPSHVGISDNSVTFHWADGKFLKTLLRTNHDYPDYSKITNLFDCEFCEQILPADFFKAIESVSDFSNNAFVHFSEGEVRSKSAKEAATSYAIGDLGKLEGKCYNFEKLLLAKPYIVGSVWISKKALGFYNGSVRGIIAQATP